ncbi:MAG TPA: hypothetical protein VNI20_07275 [Fimbriimonadaceae bacterium]|nr:hypothetical protein [Fimbriimonadaceae bacterium]
MLCAICLAVVLAPGQVRDVWRPDLPYIVNFYQKGQKVPDMPSAGKPLIGREEIAPRGVLIAPEGSGP